MPRLRVIERPGDGDDAGLDRERAELRRIGRKLMQRDADVLRRLRPQDEIGAADQNARVEEIAEMLKLRADQLRRARRRPNRRWRADHASPQGSTDAR